MKFVKNGFFLVARVWFCAFVGIERFFGVGVGCEARAGCWGGVRLPGIEPGPRPWQGRIMPLDHKRVGTNQLESLPMQEFLIRGLFAGWTGFLGFRRVC